MQPVPVRRSPSVASTSVRVPWALLAFILCLWLAVSACQPAVEPAGETADLVLHQGKIVTVDDALPEVQALASRDGKIVAVGSNEDIAPWIGPDTEVIDLQGRLAIPGFIEGHGHFMGLGLARIQLDLRQAATWQEILDMVKEAAAQAPPGEWIRGRGWHQDKWTTAPQPQLEGFPLHESLSAVAPDHPVFLVHASGHASFVNAKAMELSGIDATREDPDGGEILRDDDGQPTGLLRETAQELVRQAMGEGFLSSPAEARRMAEMASQECVAKGVTSFQDAGSSFAVVDHLRQMIDEDVVDLRLWMMIRADNEELDEKIGTYWRQSADDLQLRVGGIKLSLDGALGSRGAWLLEPYSDAPESTGLNLVSVETARRTAEIALANDVQLCIHAIGDRANREVLDLYEETFADQPKKDRRWRVEHAQHLHLDDIPRFAELGVVASMQAVHCTSDGTWVPDRLGDQRSEDGAYVWQKLIQSGAVVTNGTDAPVEDVSPIAGFYASVTRRLSDGTLFYPNQKMGRLEALRSYTLDNAFAVFEEDLKGSLEVGKLADIVVLSQDILTIPDEQILDTNVVTTIIGGEVVYRGDGS